jgi:Holliday junction resolvasome RuvABC endonuclease subunit
MQESNLPTLIAIDQSLTGTGIAVRHAGEYEIFLIQTSKRDGKEECLVCGRELKNPRSKRHINTKTHQEALEALSEDERERLERRVKELNTPVIDNTRRIREILSKVDTLCKEYGVEYGIIEGVAYGSHGNTFDLGGLFHGILDVFIRRRVKFVIIPSATAKRFWTGKGNASKEEMIDRTKELHIDIPFDFDDNCNDAFVFLAFLIKLLTGDLDREYEMLVEKSWVTRGG